MVTHYQICEGRLAVTLAGEIEAGYPRLRERLRRSQSNYVQLSDLIDTLVAAATDHDRHLANEAITILGQLRRYVRSYKVHLTEACVDRIVDSLSAGLQCRDTITTAAEAIASFGAVRGAVIAEALVDALTAGLSDESELISTVRALSSCGIDAASQSVTIIAELLRHESDEIVVVAAKALENMGLEAAPVVDSLVEAVVREDTNDYVRNSTVRALVVADPTGDKTVAMANQPTSQQRLLQQLRRLGQSDLQNEARVLRRRLQDQWSLTDERESQGQYVCEVESWSEIGLGVEGISGSDLRRYWVFSPCPQSGSRVTMDDAVELNMQGSVWINVIEAFLDSDDGVRVRDSELETRVIQHNPLRHAADQLATREEAPGRMISNRLKNNIFNQNRNLKKKIRTKAVGPFVSDGNFFRSLMPIRFLIPGNAGSFTFGPVAR